MSWSSLPFEVAEQILLSLPYHRTWPDRKLYYNPQDWSLVQCSLVSRVFHSVLTPLIYDSVHFNDHTVYPDSRSESEDPEEFVRLRLFVRTMCTSPRLARLVRKVTLFHVERNRGMLHFFCDWCRKVHNPAQVKGLLNVMSAQERDIHDVFLDAAALCDLPNGIALSGDSRGHILLMLHHLPNLRVLELHGAPIALQSLAVLLVTAAFEDLPLGLRALDTLAIALKVDPNYQWQFFDETFLPLTRFPALKNSEIEGIPPYHPHEVNYDIHLVATSLPSFRASGCHVTHMNIRLTTCVALRFDASMVALPKHLEHLSLSAKADLSSSAYYTKHYSPFEFHGTEQIEVFGLESASRQEQYEQGLHSTYGWGDEEGIEWSGVDKPVFEHFYRQLLSQKDSLRELHIEHLWRYIRRGRSYLFGDLLPFQCLIELIIPIALIIPTPDKRDPNANPTRTITRPLENILPPSLITLRLYLQPSLNAKDREPDRFAWTVEEFTSEAEIPERFPAMAARLPKLTSLTLMGVVADRTFDRAAERELLDRVPADSDIELVFDWKSL